MRARRRAALLALIGAAAMLPASAALGKGHAYAPPPGRAFHGVSGTIGKVRDFRHFQREVGSHPAVMEDFFPWGRPLTIGALRIWRQTKTRGMLSLSTKGASGAEFITPAQIARGRGDRYIVGLNRSIARAGWVVYIRLMPEMNGSWNPYCAFGPSGARRGHGHSTKWFRKAWRRFAILVHGGRVAAINHRLRKQSLPPLSRKVAGGARLPRPKVAMVWNPQTIGSPAVAGNDPGDYWPGRRYVDWVGADIYSKFATPGIRAALSSFYSRYRHLPFEIGEYGPWDSDPNGAFVRWLFKWARQHGRTKLLVYYRGTYKNSPYDINRYPDARHALRRILNEKRWIEYPPGTRHR